jgi:CRISPR-associated protein Csd1
MLLRALAAYADIYLADALHDPAFEQKGVPWLLSVAIDGRFVGIGERTQTTQRGAKTVSRALPLRVPRSPGARNSAVMPLLGVDSLQYVLGVGDWTRPDQVNNHQCRHQAFVALLDRAASETGDPLLTACCAFYRHPIAVEAARSAMAKAFSGALPIVALSVHGSLEDGVGDRVACAAPAAMAWWRRHYAAQGRHKADAAVAPASRCLVSGALAVIAPTHEKVKNATRLGGQASGLALISFDKPAFTSYGWEKNENAPVSRDRAMAYVLALSDLLQPGQHRQGTTTGRLVTTCRDIGSDSMLFWTSQPTDDDFMSVLDQADDRDVVRLLDAPFRGDAPAGSADDLQFFLVVVAANGARLVVRDWRSDSLSGIRSRLREWFRDIAIADVFESGSINQAIPLWALVMALMSRMDAKGGPPVERARFSRALTLRALFGVPVGSALLAAALGRYRLSLLSPPKDRDDRRRTSDHLSPQRVAVIRLATNDCLRRIHPGGPLVSPALDDSPTMPVAYVCGRLLAMYDALQYRASHRPAKGATGEAQSAAADASGQRQGVHDSTSRVNETVADRFFAMASTTPALAFRTVATLGQKHLAKLRRGGDDDAKAAWAIDAQLSALMQRIDGATGFPERLELVDQGRFVLGYHHQKAADAAARAESRAAKAPPTLTPQQSTDSPLTSSEP